MGTGPRRTGAMERTAQSIDGIDYRHAFCRGTSLAGVCYSVGRPAGRAVFPQRYCPTAQCVCIPVGTAPQYPLRTPTHPPRQQHHIDVGNPTGVTLVTVVTVNRGYPYKRHKCHNRHTYTKHTKWSCENYGICRTVFLRQYRSPEPGEHSPAQYEAGAEYHEPVGTNTVPAPQLSLFQQYTDAWGELNARSDLDSFVCGFRLGAQMTLDTFLIDEEER